MGREKVKFIRSGCPCLLIEIKVWSIPMWWKRCTLDLTSQSEFVFLSVKMSLVWSMLWNVIIKYACKLNGYKSILEEHPKHITCLQSYQDCIEHLFADQIYNFGWVNVWFHISEFLYSRIPIYDKEPFHEAVCKWFYVFEKKNVLITIVRRHEKRMGAIQSSLKLVRFKSDPLAAFSFAALGTKKQQEGQIWIGLR